MKDPVKGGIMPQALRMMVEAMHSSKSEMGWTIKLSYVEIYKEKILDLLNPTKDNLKIFDLPDDGVGLQEVTQGTISERVESSRIASQLADTLLADTSISGLHGRCVRRAQGREKEPLHFCYKDECRELSQPCTSSSCPQSI